MSATLTLPLPATIPLLHPPGAEPSDRLRRFTRAEYHKMMDAGILYEAEPVELLEGLVVCKMSRNTPHEAGIRRVTVRLPRHLPGGWFVQIRNAIGLPDGEPEPDAAVLRGDLTDYDDHHPEPAEVGLVIEVADSSLSFDRRDKGRMYARAGIPAYWVLNVVDRVVEVYGDPDPVADPPAYRARTDYAPGQEVPLVLDGMTAARVPVSDLIP